MALPLSVDAQNAKLRANCPQFSLIAHAGFIGVWDGTLRPVCQTYRVRIVYYARRYFPGFDLTNPYLSVFVIDPPIGRDPRKTGEPAQHVYRLGHHPDFPRLCIYDPAEDNWQPSEYLVDRVIPWIIKWLFFHEEWVATGVWKGGGRHPEISKCPTPQENLDLVNHAQQERYRNAEFHRLGRKIGLSASSLSMAVASVGFSPQRFSRISNIPSPEEIQLEIISILPWAPLLAGSSRSGWAQEWRLATSLTSISNAEETSFHLESAAA